MKIAKTIEEIRGFVKAARIKGKRIGFVPTMGALHIGHISLLKQAVRKCDFVVVSIFVNPTQFGAGEDFEQYPCMPEADIEICEKSNVDVVFYPTANEVYGDENLTWISVEKVTEFLCGRSRPTHFRGVATVCAKLFNIVGPDFAFFGQKDAQQGIVIKKMVADLNMPLQIIICPTVREPDGLAVSSRNQYLSKAQRKDAVLVYQSLVKAEEIVEKGIVETKEIISAIRNILSQSPMIGIDYVDIVDIEKVQQLQRISGKALIAVAVKIGSTRLIDNIVVDVGK
ncbi:MAG: pantoate--beta-alanine ligase [Planctomycetota bacterium]|jgi:pantoate--beta-alanine ligase